MRKFTILLIFTLLFKSIAVTPQSLDSTEIIEKRLILNVFTDLKANSELADSLYKEVLLYQKLDVLQDSSISYCDRLTNEQDVLLKACNDSNSKLQRKLKVSKLTNKITLVLLFVALVCIPLF